MAIYDPDSAIGKQITIFLRKAKLISDPIQLLGSSNYTAWKEFILSRAKTLKCHYLLEEKETTSPTDTAKVLWEYINDWLYDLMWNSISPQAKLRLETPTDRIAYNLWMQAGTKFQRPIEEQRRQLFRDLAYLTPKNCKDVREYLHKFQDLRMQLARLNHTVPDWVLLDILYGNITKVHRDFIQLKTEQQRTSNFEPVNLDIDTLISEITSRLPKKTKDQTSEGNQALHAGENKRNNSGKQDQNQNQNNDQNQA
jgi:hypothetical protein